jgi:hypothetical protein
MIYALDLDEELLAHLVDPLAWTYLKGENFSPKLIEDDFVRKVYDWQQGHMRDYGMVATGSVLENQFEDLAMLEPETAIGDLIDRMRYRYAKGRQREKMEELILIQNEDPMAVVQAMGQAFKELNALLVKKGEMYGNGDFERVMSLYDRKVLQGPGASYGHPDLDSYFFGMRGLNFLIAPPKTYKSWGLVQAALGNILDGRSTHLETLELPADETYQRLIHLIAGVPYWHYLRNKISKEERRTMKEATELVEESGIIRVHKAPSGERSIDRIVGTARDAGAEVILIDQLQYIEGTNSTSIGAHNHTGEYWNVLNRARDLSDEGPLYIAHQFNRSVQFSDDMPSMEQIKGSSAVEETATLALGQWANAGLRSEGKLRIGVLCSRNYQYAAWEMEVELSKGCSFQIIERVPDENV